MGNGILCVNLGWLNHKFVTEFKWGNKISCFVIYFQTLRDCHKYISHINCDHSTCKCMLLLLLKFHLIKHDHYEARVFTSFILYFWHYLSSFRVYDVYKPHNHIAHPVESGEGHVIRLEPQILNNYSSH